MTAHRTTSYRHRRRAATAAALAAAALLLAGCGGDGGSAAAADAPEACSVYAGSGDGGGDPAALTACAYLVHYYQGDDDEACALRHPDSPASPRDGEDPDACIWMGSTNYDNTECERCDEEPVEVVAVGVVPGDADSPSSDGLPDGVAASGARAFCVEGPDSLITKVSVAPTEPDGTGWLVYHDKWFDSTGPC